MHDPTPLKAAKWPFFAGDLLLLGTAYWISTSSKTPVETTSVALATLCVAFGAALAVVPFILEYRALAKMVEAGALTTVIEQIQKLETVASQISSATGSWQNVQDAADKTTLDAKAIAERIGAEAKAFKEFMQRINDSERATLRLEVEKLRRAEGDWLQVLVRMLDHVYALHNGALRSGQPNLIEQLGQFQNACREAARRVGLTPFLAVASEPFDAQRHQLVDGNGAPEPGALVAETVATGYTFQGRLLRQAIVRLTNGGVASTQPANSPVNEPNEQDQLPLSGQN